MPRIKTRVAASALMLMCLAGTAFAAAENKASKAIACPGPNLAPLLKQHPDRQNSPIILKSKAFNVPKEEMAEARGEVELHHGDQLLTTELLRYNPGNKTANSPGPLHYEDDVMSIKSINGEYSFLEDHGHFSEIDYDLAGSNGHGKAAEANIDSGNHSVLRRLDFSTCAGDKPEWILSAKKLNLDFDKGVGTAKNAKLKFFNVPILYLPYLSFPINNQRKSGFLWPYLSTTNDTGVEIGIPFYWNIAANQDATLTPRFYTDRGAMLSTEYRYITRHSGAILNLDWLPHDKKTGENRYHYTASHSARLGRNWRSRIRLDRVSDDRYFQDFGDTLAITSREFLRSKAGLYGSGRHWVAALIIDDFQVVDDVVNKNNKPYSRLPRLTFGLDQPIGHQGMSLRLDAELVNFDRDVGVSGARLDLYPRLEWNMETSWGYLRPSVGERYTSYKLNRHGLPGGTSPDRLTEILSLDSGLFFQRDGKNGKLQTLEPRLFYLYVPYKNQDNLPDFDSAPFTFGFSQLFHYNRFAGADRQSDANQLTVAVTTRSYNQRVGRELWSLSLGQIFYFEKLRVVPGFKAPDDDSISPFIADFVLHISRHLSSHMSAQWNWNTQRVDVAVLGVKHIADNGRHIGFEYRFRRTRVDQFDIRYFQPINERWRLLSRVNYSFKDSDLLVAEAGFEYDSCCWALNLVAKHYLRNRSGGFRDALFLQLQLKGLASIGNREAPLFYDLAQ